MIFENFLTFKLHSGKIIYVLSEYEGSAKAALDYDLYTKFVSKKSVLELYITSLELEIEETKVKRDSFELYLRYKDDSNEFAKKMYKDNQNELNELYFYQSLTF